MGSNTTDQTASQPSDLFEPSSDMDLTKPSGEPVAGAEEAVVNDCADVPADDGSNGSYFSDVAETVISKDPPVVQSSSSVGDITIIAGTPKQLGAMLEGATLEHLKLEKFVGGGGMGAVFRALDTNLNRTVAVKVLSGDRTDRDTQQRFQKEAQNAAQLDHKNIAQVFHVGEDKGLHYIVFEFIEGVNIRDLVKQNGPLPLEEAISYMLQLAAALDHASQRDIVHRDIKPSNVLVTAEGHAKLVDMGLARLHHLESKSEDLTASGVTLGTFDYISPEQARDPRLADVRSDLYSLGCTFYFMLTGKPPFPDGTVLQKLLRHSSEQPADPRQVRTDLDERIVDVMDKLLAKQPGDRYQRPTELIDEFHEVAEQLNLPGIARKEPASTPVRARGVSLVLRSLPWAVPLALLIVAVFALDSVWPTSASVDFSRTKVELAPPLENSAIEPPPKVEPSQADEGRGDDSSQDASTTGKDAAAAPAAEPKPDTKPASSDGKPSASKADTDTPVPAGGSDLPAAKKTMPAEERTDADASPPTEIPTGDSDTPSPAPPADDPSAKDAIDATDDSRKPKTGASSAGPQNALAERIIVGSIDGAAPDDAVVVESLAAACQKAAAMGVDTVELHFNGMRTEQPFDVTAKQLTIRKGDGFKPTIVFHPSFEDMAQDHQMIRLGSGELDWQGVHLRFELPEQSAEGWSLFRLRHIVGLKMRDSIVTVRNVDESGRLVQPRVAVFEVENGTGLGVPAATSESGPYIDLQQCIVRGQTTIVRTEEVSSFRFACQQCLLITSDRLLDAREVRAGVEWKDGPNEVILNHVTAVLGQGLCRFGTDDASYRPVWVTECTDSIVYVTDLQAPIIEWKGITGIDDLDQPLYVQKGCNFYPGSMTLLRVNPTGDPSQYVNCDFGQHDAIWYLEHEPPRFTLSWNKELPLALTEDLQAPTDYTLAEQDDSSARDAGEGLPVGVDPDLLPMVHGGGAQRAKSVAAPSSDL